MSDPQTNPSLTPLPSSTPISTDAGRPGTVPLTSETLVPPIEVAASGTPGLKWITHLSSLVVILATAAYMIGFIVVNTHLFNYGMVPYDFLQPRYLSAGLLYLASTVGLTCFIALLIHIVKKHFSGDQAKAELQSTLTFLFIVWVASPNTHWLIPKSENLTWWPEYLYTPLILLALAMAMSDIIMLPISKIMPRVCVWWRENLWKDDRLFGIVVVLVLVSKLAELGYSFVFYPAFFLCTFLVYAGLFGFRSDQGRVEISAKSKTDALLFGLACLGLSVYAYATLTYPLISPHVGGGKPLLVSLSLKPEHSPTIGKIMGREDSNCVMHNIALIHENSELIYILPKGYYANESAIAIPKSQLVSIAYQKNENKDESATCLK